MERIGARSMRENWRASLMILLILKMKVSSVGLKYCILFRVKSRIFRAIA
jgi:hypothetical protein